MAVDGKSGDGKSGQGSDPARGIKGDLTAEERAALERRSGELGRKLDAARETGVHGGRPKPPGGSGNSGAMGRAMRLSAELIGGVVAGGALHQVLAPFLFSQALRKIGRGRIRGIARNRLSVFFFNHAIGSFIMFLYQDDSVHFSAATLVQRAASPCK